MTTENQTTLISPKSTTATNKLMTKLEEQKGNSIKPLSMRPNRSVKKNLSLKPTGLKSR